MWAVRKGYYTCEACGLLREASRDSQDMGTLEASVVESLKKFPPEATGEVLAQAMLHTARLLDHDEVNPRDVPLFMKELRQTLAQLEIMFPAEPEDDDTAKAQKRISEKMTGLAEGEWNEP